jgi:hypothetical protein
MPAVSSQPRKKPFFCKEIKLMSFDQNPPSTARTPQNFL